MAQIDSVNYVELATEAKRFREQGTRLNEELTKIYTRVRDMRKDWYGRRYNQLTIDFNNLAPAINKITNLVVCSIPDSMETIANNYSFVDRGSKIGDVNHTDATKMIIMEPTTEESMRFETAGVNECHTSVISSFTIVLDLMENISNMLYRLVEVVWISDSSRAYREKYNVLKNEVISAIENIKMEFDLLMKQTLEDLQRAENANTVQ